MYVVLKVYDIIRIDLIIILDSSAVEHPAVNRRVVGSNPTRGAFFVLSDEPDDW